MSGNKCQYTNCGKTKKKFPELRLYRFPKDKRAEIWMTNSGNSRLFSIDGKKLYNRYICEEHFPPKSFVNSTKNRLVNSAIPYCYQSEEHSSTSSNFNLPIKCEQENFKTPTKICTHSESDTVKFNFPSNQKSKITDTIQKPSPNLKKKYPWKYDSIITDTTTKLKLKQRKKLIHNKKSLNSKFKNSNFNMHNNLKHLVNTYNFCSRSSKAMVTMQLKDKYRPWTINEKNLALNLFYKSPTAYKFLYSQKVNLPELSTIRRWVGQSKFLPSFNKLFFSDLQKKFELFDYKEKACTVCFDEMNVQEFLECSKEFNFIEGFEDFGHYGKTNKSVNCILVLARGIYSSWRFPIAYFLTNSRVNKINLKQLIIDVLQKLFEVGFCPKTIVCDRGTKNQSTLKSLNITEETPFFYINNNKIVYLYV